MAMGKGFSCTVLSNTAHRFICLLILILPGYCWGQSTSENFTSSGFFTVPPGVTSITVECWGAGGGGGGSSSFSNGGAGGGAGGYCKKTLAVVPSSSFSFVVGVGGIGGTTSGGTGGNGGSTTFLSLIANGGTGGSGNGGRVGVGGDAVGGDQNLTGSNGLQGGAAGGNGGNAAGTNGGAGGVGGQNAAGGVGTSPGGGGGGGKSFFRGNAGGAGGNGLIVISYIPGYYAKFTGCNFGSSTWNIGETRDVSITLTNAGQAVWGDSNPDINIGVRWSDDPVYSIKVDAAGLSPGASRTYNFQVTAPITVKNQCLIFDVINEGNFNFGDQDGSTAFTSAEITLVDPPIYYSQRSGDPADLNNWRTLGGRIPSGFNTPGQSFVIQQGHTMTTSSAGWTMSGANTKLQIRSGGVLTATNGAVELTSATTFQLDAGATYNHNCTSAAVWNSTEVFDPSSTVVYGGAMPQQIANITYGCLTITGGVKTLAASTSLRGVLTLNGAILQLDDKNLTLASTASCAGSFSSASMVLENGTGVLRKEGVTAVDFKGVYPIGNAGAYAPVEIASLSVSSLAPAASISFTTKSGAAVGIPGNTPLLRNWVTATSGFNGSIVADIRFEYGAGDVDAGSTGTLEIYAKPATGTWGFPAGAGPRGANPLRAAAATSLDATWSASVPERRVFFSMRSGGWDDPQIWTLDPSGTQYLNPNGYTPSTSPTKLNDEVVILSGRTVVAGAGGVANKVLQVIGTIDFIASTGNSFNSIKGSGRIRLAADNFPNGAADDFVAEGEGEGTVEYYGSSRDLTVSRTFYNLIINADNGNTIALRASYIINGDLTIANGTLMIGSDAATIPLAVTVKKDMLVSAVGRLVTGSGNARHQLNLYGNFTNNGEVRFTNRTSADYTSEATNGIVDVNFLNSSADQSVFCRGITNFYRIKIDKGSDQTYTLNIDANAVTNFNLLGFANENHGAVPQPGNNMNALGLVRGTVRIGNGIVIPVLSKASNYSVFAGARLLVEEGIVQRNDGILTVYGTVHVKSGTLDAKAAGGISLAGAGILKIDGGIVNTSQIRVSDFSGSNSGGYIQSGGIVNVIGGNVFPGNYAFMLSGSGSVFNMSGGTLKVNPTPQGGVLINSDLENVLVTGGTVIAETNGSGSFTITSKAPFWNLTLTSTSAGSGIHKLGGAVNVGAPSVSLGPQPLVVLNDFRICGTESNVSRAVTFDPFTPSANDVTVGGSLFIEGGAAFKAVSGSLFNTLRFNKSVGTSSVEELYWGNGVTPLDLGNIEIDRPAGYELKITSNGRVNESVALNINGSAAVLSGALNQNLYSVKTLGSIVNYGRMGTWYRGVTPSRAQILISSNPTILSSSGAIFGNVKVDIPATSRLTLGNDTYFERMEYVKGLVYLKSYNLKIDELWGMEAALFENILSGSYLKVLNSGFSAGSLIFTDGKASDGGLSLKVLANSLPENQNNILNNFGPITYPIGFTPDGGTTLFFRPAQLVVKAFNDDGYITIRPVMGSLKTAAYSAGEILQHYWKVTNSDFSAIPAVAYRFYYRNNSSVTNVDLPTGAMQEASYVPGKVLNENPYTRLYEANTDDIVRGLGSAGTRAIVFNGSSAGGLFTPAAAGIPLENACYTAGVSGCFVGAPSHYYSKGSYASWSDAWTWDVGSVGSGLHGVPSTGSIVHIYNDISTPNNPGQVGRISVNGSGIPNPPAEIIFEMPNLPLDQATAENVPRLQFYNSVSANLGAVKGVGMLSFGVGGVSLSGDFGDFGTNPRSYYLYYNGGGAPSEITNIPNPIPNLMVEYSAAINQNIVVNNDLIVQLGATVRPLQDIWIKRDLLVGFYNGGFFSFPATGSPVRVTVDRNVDMTQVPPLGNQDPRGVLVSTNTGSLIHTLVVKGSILQGANDGWGIDLYGNSSSSKVNLELQGSSSGSYTRSSASVPALYRIIMNKGNNQGPTFTFSKNFMLNGAANGAVKSLEMRNGTLVLDDPAFNINLSTGGSYFDIPSTSALVLNRGSAAVTGGSGIGLGGLLKLSNTGVMNMSGSENSIEYSASGGAVLDVSGTASLIVGGQIRRSPTADGGVLRYSQSGGSVVVGQAAASVNSRGVFEVLNPGSVFNMTGGDLFIARSQISPAISAFYFNPDICTVAGGARIHIGHASTPDSREIGIYAGKPLPMLRIDNSSGRGTSAKLDVVPATITTLLLVDAGASLNANGINLTLNGDFTCSGVYKPNGNTTFLAGTTDQTVTGNGSLLNFYNLDKVGANKVILSGSTSSLAVANDLFLRSGVLTTNDNTVSVGGSLLNDALHEFTGIRDGIVLNGNLGQTLSGNGTFGKLTIDNSNIIDVPVGNHLKVANSLKMKAGVLNIGRNLFDIGANAIVEPASPFSKSNMITTNISFTDNGLRKFFNAGAQQEFIYPVGSVDKYTPVTVKIDANNGGGSITAKPANEIHPSIAEDLEPATQITDKKNVLQYYWTLKSSGMSGLSGSVLMNYNDEDVKVENPPYTIANYVTAQLLNNGSGLWKTFGTTDFDESQKLLKFSFTNKGDDDISGDYTGGIADAIPRSVGRYETNNSGSWKNGTIWTPNVVGGPVGAIAKINRPHTVDITTNGVYGYLTEIQGALKLYESTGHRLGIVTGTGTMSMEIGVIPAAVYDDFFATGGGTLEFGGVGKSYEFLGNIFEVNNLKMTGSGERRFPNNNLLLNGNMEVSGAAGLDLLNYYNRRLSVKGDVVRTGGSFDAGYGSNATVSLVGTFSQKITGSFSNTNAFNNLEIDNVNGVSTVNDVEIDRELRLTNGLINVNQGSLFRLNYSAFVTPAAGTSNSFVNGTLTKEMITGNSFTFPVGNKTTNNNHGPITLLNVSQPVGLWDWSTAYTYDSPANAGMPVSSVASSVSSVSNTEFWKIQAPAGGQAAIRITLDGSSDIASNSGDLSTLRVLGWNSTTAKWEIVGGSAVIVGSKISGSVTTTSPVNFGSYTYFTIGSVAPLVLGSASFTTQDNVAVCKGKSTTLDVAFSGSQPWVLTYTDGSSTIVTPPITASPYRIVVSPASTTAYTLKSVSANGVAGTITGRSVVTVAVNAVPAVNFTATPSAVCEGASVMLNATPGDASYNYKFRINGTVVNGGGAGSNVNSYTTVVPPGSSSADVVVTTTGNCSVTSSPVPIVVTARPSAAGVIDGLVSICLGKTETYTIPVIAGANTYSWSATNGATGSSTGNSILLTFPNSGASIVTVLGRNGCGDGASSSIQVNVSSGSAVTQKQNISSGNINVCEGGGLYVYNVPVIANATGYKWYFSGSGVVEHTSGSVVSSSGFTTATNSIMLDFSETASSGVLTVRGVSGCSSGDGPLSDSYQVVVNTHPAAAIATVSPVCTGRSVTLLGSYAGGSAPFSYQWSGPGASLLNDKTSLTPLFVSAAGGTFDLLLTVKDVNGCAGAASTTVSVNQAPVANAGADIAGICTGISPVTLSGATASGSFSGIPLWSGSGGMWTQNPDPALATFTPSTPYGTIEATLTLTGSGGCNDVSDTRIITWGSKPDRPGAFTLSSSAVCAGQADVAYEVPDNSNVTSYSWVYTGTGVTGLGTSAHADVDFSNVATSGTIKVYCVNACGMSDLSRDVSVLVNTLPDIPNLTAVAACAGDIATLGITNPQSGYTYVWSVSSVDFSIPNAGIPAPQLRTPSNDQLFPVVSTLLDFYPDISVRITDANGCSRVGGNAIQRKIVVHRIPRTGPPYHVGNSIGK